MPGKTDEDEAPLSCRKADNFSDWYNELVERAGLCDKRYPVKGLNVWTAYGWKAMSLIDAFIRKEMERTGHSEVNFPLLIPDTEFKKEAEHIKGFSQEVFWVHEAGGGKLDVPLLLRPTSETAMYPVFALWVRSHADLPLKTFQIVSVFRCDTKQTRAFIRVREIHFFEGHTCHATFEDAEAQIREDLDIMARLAHALCLPYGIHRRPEWDKFPGAFYTMACDAWVADAGRTLQVGTIHQYRDNFARAYGIMYEDDKGERRHVHQTTYGMSERLLGAVVAVHGDDAGLIMPPAIAPVQVVIVPVLVKGRQAEVEEECRKLAGELSAAGLRVHLDMRDIRPGSKYYHWELRGVPLRAELGPRDIAKGEVVIVRRDTREKAGVKRAEAGAAAARALEAVADTLRGRAGDTLGGATADITSMDGLAGQGRIVRFPWCGGEECGKSVEEKGELHVLGTRVPDVPVDDGALCAVCGRQAKVRAVAARTF